MAVARVRAARLALLDLHKSLISAERRRFEASRGPIGGPHQALTLLLSDPFFAWLQPLAQLIVLLDEWLDDDAPRLPNDVPVLFDRISGLLSGGADEAFQLEYRRALQDSPEVVVCHGRVAALVGA